MTSGWAARMRGRRRRGDDGFSLTEVIIATVTLGALAAAASLFFLSSLRATAELQHRQLASSIAAEALERVRSVPTQPDSSGCLPFLAGRTQALVTSQWAAAPSGVDLSTTDAAWTPASCTGSVAVPFAGLSTAVTDDGTTPAITRDGVGYVVRTWIGSCRIPLTGGACAKAANVLVSATTLYRVVVAVGWKAASCPSSGCLFTVSTLLDPSVDPVFNARSAVAPTAVNDVVCTPTGVPVVLALLANDVGTLGASPVTVTSQPGHGTLTSAIATGTGIYTPNPLWTGVDSFTYKLISTGGVLSAAATVSITVAATC